ncbi:MAG: DUF4118 domain-containing protein [Acidimicrobiia bacterium]|nr:DUF4118 domain-containing protein [Acidimicrobiia bacterium]
MARRQIRMAPAGLSRRNVIAGWVVAAAGLAGATVTFTHTREWLGISSVLLGYLALAVLVALIGGSGPASAVVFGGFALTVWFFTSPLYRLSVREVDSQVALLVYVVVSFAVILVVDRARRVMKAAAARPPVPTKAPPAPPPHVPSEAPATVDD